MFWDIPPFLIHSHSLVFLFSPFLFRLLVYYLSVLSFLSFIHCFSLISSFFSIHSVCLSIFFFFTITSLHLLSFVSPYSLPFTRLFVYRFSPFSQFIPIHLFISYLVPFLRFTHTFVIYWFILFSSSFSSTHFFIYQFFLFSNSLPFTCLFIFYT